jgi:beta-phosphoglucomutase-like phosphatase (HAD superfamily)
MSDGVQAALIGASIGGLIALVGTMLSALFADRRLRAEALKRDVEWRREKCNEAYSQAIYFLFKLQSRASSDGLTDETAIENLSEAQRYLSLLQAYHPRAEERSKLSGAAEHLKACAKGSVAIALAAEAARNVVEHSLHSTWSPTVRQS